MKLVEKLRPECVCALVKCADKEALLHEVTRVARQSSILRDLAEDVVFEALQEREQLGSTGFGHGIAIPHCRLDGADDFVVGLLSVPDGVEFDSIDGEPVKLVAFIIAPLEATNNHIRLLSAISQAFSIPGAVDEMVAQPSSEALRESFLRHIRDELSTKDHTSMSMMHVYVQEEDYFRDILQILAGFQSSSTMVMEAENTGAYLSKVPLFADFWRDNARGFNQVIVSIVEKRLANEIVRRIQAITGNLDAVDGVLITIQDLEFATGTINA